MDLSLLHKKLLLNWSAGTVSKSISTPSSLNSIQHGFDKLESKIKMRVLMSLLNFDPKTKADCIAPIKELIRLAADDTKSGKWLTVVAGLVNDRLLGSTDCEEEVNEGGAFFYLEDAADKIVEQLSRKDVASRAQCSLNFQPLELKYLIRGEDFNSDGLGPGSSDSRHNGNASSGHSQLHFTYSGETPDFISKACKSLEDRQITDQKNKNMPAIGKNRDSFKHLLPGDNSSSSGSYGSSGGSNASSSYISGIARARTLPPASSRPGISSSFTGGSQGNGQRQASKMMMLDQVDLRMQQSASAGLSGVSEGSSSSLKRKGPSTAGDVQGPKSRLKVGEKTEKEKVDTPSDLKAAVVKDKEKEKIAAIPVPVPQKESKSGAAAVAVAALLNSNKANSTTSDSVSSSSKLDVGTKGGISVVPVLEIAASQLDKSTSAILRSIVESKVESSTADNSQALKVVAPAPAVTVTAPLPVKAAQEMVPPSAPSSSASATTSMVEALFLSSPLLTTANRTTIQNFFSDDWRSHFPPAFTAENPVLKIKLSTEEKMGDDGQNMKETIYLHLEFNPHSWKKIKKKNKINVKEKT